MAAQGSSALVFSQIFIQTTLLAKSTNCGSRRFQDFLILPFSEDGNKRTGIHTLLCHETPLYQTCTGTAKQLKIFLYSSDIGKETYNFPSVFLLQF